MRELWGEVTQSDSLDRKVELDGRRKENTVELGQLDLLEDRAFSCIFFELEAGQRRCICVRAELKISRGPCSRGLQVEDSSSSFAPPSQLDSPPSFHDLSSLLFFILLTFALFPCNQQRRDRSHLVSRPPQGSFLLLLFAPQLSFHAEADPPPLPSSFSPSQMLKHGRAGVPMEVMGLMLGEFVDEYTVSSRFHSS